MIEQQVEQVRECVEIGLPLIECSGKRPINKDWPNNPIRSVGKVGSKNYGMISEWYPAIDVDLKGLDGDKSSLEKARILRLVQAITGADSVLYRTGHPTSIVVPFRLDPDLDEPFPKRVHRVKGGAIELLCQGQQYIIAGDYPRGEGNYAWRRYHGPGNGLPKSGSCMVRQWATALANAPLWDEQIWRVLVSGGEVKRAVRPDTGVLGELDNESSIRFRYVKSNIRDRLDAIYTKCKRLNDPPILKKGLRLIDSYEGWREGVGMALAGEAYASRVLAEEVDGMPLWKYWSAKPSLMGKTYDPASCAKFWPDLVRHTEEQIRKGQPIRMLYEIEKELDKLLEMQAPGPSIRPECFVAPTVRPFTGHPINSLIEWFGSDQRGVCFALTILSTVVKSNYCVLGPGVEREQNSMKIRDTALATPLNLYNLLSMDSGAGKTAMLQQTQDLLEETETVVSGASSPQGLRRQLEQTSAILLCMDEWAQSMTSLKASKHPYEELLRNLTGSAALGTLRAYVKADKKENYGAVSCPHLSLIGLSTPEHLHEFFSSESRATDGTLNRFLLFDDDTSAAELTDLTDQVTQRPDTSGMTNELDAIRLHEGLIEVREDYILSSGLPVRKKYDVKYQDVLADGDWIYAPTLDVNTGELKRMIPVLPQDPVVVELMIDISKLTMNAPRVDTRHSLYNMLHEKGWLWNRLPVPYAGPKGLYPELRVRIYEHAVQIAGLLAVLRNPERPRISTGEVLFGLNISAIGAYNVEKALHAGRVGAGSDDRFFNAAALVYEEVRAGDLSDRFRRAVDSKRIKKGDKALYNRLNIVGFALLPGLFNELGIRTADWEQHVYPELYSGAHGQEVRALHGTLQIKRLRMRGNPMKPRTGYFLVRSGEDERALRKYLTTGK